MNIKCIRKEVIFHFFKDILDITENICMLTPILCSYRVMHYAVSGQACLLDPRMHDISVVCQLDLRILLHMLYEVMYHRLCLIDLHLPLY
jgi:hypothetical protein